MYLFNVLFMAQSPWELAEHRGRIFRREPVGKGESGITRVLHVVNPVLKRRCCFVTVVDEMKAPGGPSIIQTKQVPPFYSISALDFLMPPTYFTPSCLLWHLDLLIFLFPSHLFISIWFSTTKLSEPSSY